jgi:hypothetical protein
MHPVLRIKGTVVKGFGRGSRELGIPTANVDANSLRGVLAEAVTGAVCGQWAGNCGLTHSWLGGPLSGCLAAQANHHF